KVSAVAREQHLARHARAASGPNEVELEAQRAREEKAERDRALEAERRQQARTRERCARRRARSSPTSGCRTAARSITASPPVARSARCRSARNCAAGWRTGRW